jgi:tetratricopeptide (TPR) repeat protein
MRTLRHLAAALALLGAPLARAQLGIDLTPDEKKAEEKKETKPAKPKASDRKPPEAAPRAPPPPVAMPELDVAGKKGEAGRRLAAARKVFDDKDYEMAALAYDAVVRDAALAEAHDEARLGEAKSLERLGLHHAAGVPLDDILSKGPGSPSFKDALDWLLYVGKKTANAEGTVAQVARYAGGALPSSSQDKVNYLLARYAYERGKALDEAGQRAEARRAFDEARRLAALVRPDAGGRPAARGDGDDEGDVYAKARFLDGLVLYVQGNVNGALDSFKEVVRLTNPRRARAPDPHLRELAFLQLARLHYEHKQNRYAIFYYDKMPWGGDSWLEGLWEASYAHYRIGDYEKALGNLLTLQSPYFRDEWFPESWILKAIIYYENCRYPEARAILDEFHGLYEPVHAELDRLTARQGTPSTFFDLIDDAQKGRGPRADGLMRRIMKLSFTDKNIKRLDEAVLEIEGEMERGLAAPARRQAFATSSLASDLKVRLAAERRRLVDEAGARARAKLEYERDALRDLLQQALRIKIEVSRKEREALESALSRGGPVDVVRDYRYSVAVSDEHLYWPYDGEFWRDELGTYTYTLTKGCRDTGARSAAR